MKQQELNITIPLSCFVSSHLGVTKDGSHLWDHKEIDQDIALLIFSLTNNKTHHCYIQWADEMSPDLQKPVLWDAAAWQVSAEKFNRIRAYSEAQRIERDVLTANIKLVSDAYQTFVGCSIDNADVIAYKLLMDDNIKTINMFGVKKLKTKDDL